ncbi:MULTISPECIES: VOC family protein [Paenibacillus]|uniref:VOC family protein n=1 Tax=Paenibacillus TaxID=44249 RepID=UPI0022B8D1DC|nr:VOC family protein [Paenibacillus caseinilyticus]MCZ8519783.1 VOC family protein [Paenibacillus caseinilyticus]
MRTLLDQDTSIGLIQLKVSELQRSLRFYTEVIGYRLLGQKGRKAELTVDGVHPALILEELPNALPVPRRSAAGLYHFAILVPDRRSLGLVLQKLLDHGLHVGQGDHLVSEALYVTDPDLNGIEIYADRPREGWRRDALGHYIMSTDPVDAEGLLREAAGHSWSGLPAGTVTGHIHLHVSDLGRAEKFYTELLGFDKTAGDSQSVLFVSAGGYHHHIGLNTWAGQGAPAPHPNAVGLAFYTLVIPRGLEEAVRRLEAAGVPVRQEGGEWITQDPSGIELHLTERPFSHAMNE